MATNLNTNEKRTLNHISPLAPHLGDHLKTFVAGEAARIVAEGLRVTAEDARVIAETARDDAEILREEAQDLRAANGPFALACDYDFAEDGGLIGDIAFVGSLPLDAIIVNVKSDIITPFTSGGSATIAIFRGAQELMAAVAFDHASLTGIDDHTVANVKITAAGVAKMVIAGANLTAGKGRFIIEYRAGSPTA